jgi:hypothetical protein
MNEALVANKWYPHYKGPGRSYINPYPTPQSILRRAVGAEEYKFVCETVTTEHIRAAVIMPLAVPFQHLLNDVPWGMSYRDESWRMIVVSTVDPNRWIDLARASGAIAWLKGHKQTYTYNWEPPPTDATGNKIRPPNALGINDFDDGKRVYKKKYSVAAVIEDIKRGYLTHRQIADLHNITSNTVSNISKRAGLTMKRGNAHVTT